MEKFGGFVITRDAANDGGDFVAYVKDVKMLYDKAVLEPAAISTTKRFGASSARRKKSARTSRPSTSAPIRSSAILKG